MRDHLTLFSADADQWEADGITLEDEDALVMSLWRWYRGRPSTVGLSVSAKVLYSYIVRQREAQERIYAARSVAGKKGAAFRWGCDDFANGKTDGKPKARPMAKICPTATATATATATSTASLGEGAVAPKPPAHTRERFVVPSVDEVRAYCDEQGFADVDPHRFVDYFESKGWIVGKANMKDWRAAVRNWHRREAGGGSAGGGRSQGVGIQNMSRREDDYGL